MELVKQLWRGEVPLVRTYWIFGALVMVCVNFAWVVIEFNYARILVSFGQYPIWILLVAQYTYFPFIYVAIWKSANKYAGPRHWSVLAKIAVGVSALSLIVGAIKEYESATKINLVEQADVLNRSLPIMIDDVTQAYRVSAEKKQLTYHLRIIGMNPSDTEPSVFYKRMRPRFVTQACGAADMKPLFQNGITVTYSFKTSNDTLIANVVITPEDCGY